LTEIAQRSRLLFLAEFSESVIGAQSPLERSGLSVSEVRR